MGIVVRLGPVLVRSALPCGSGEEESVDLPLNARLRRSLERWEPAFSIAWRTRASCPAGRQAVSEEDWQPSRFVILEDLRVDAGKLFEIPRGCEGPVAASEVAHIFHWRLQGRDVAVKVQRRSLRENVLLDVRILRMWARVLSVLARFVPSRCGGDAATAQSARYLVDLDRCAKSLQVEFDYHQAARQQARFRNEVISHVPGAILPGVCWEATAGRVLTTTWVEGAQLTDLGLKAEAFSLLGVTALSTDGAPAPSLVANGLVVASEAVGSGTLLSLALQVSSCPTFTPGDDSSRISSRISSALPSPRSNPSELRDSPAREP